MLEAPEDDQENSINLVDFDTCSVEGSAPMSASWSLPGPRRIVTLSLFFLTNIIFIMRLNYAHHPLSLRHTDLILLEFLGRVEY